MISGGDGVKPTAYEQGMGWAGAANQSLGMVGQILGNFWKGDLDVEKVRGETQKYLYKSQAEIAKWGAMKEIEHAKSSAMETVAKVQAETRNKEIKAAVQMKKIEEQGKLSRKSIEGDQKKHMFAMALANKAFMRRSYQ